ncbi:MAG TPA: hypothetical protein VGM28_07205 [Candidatus Limnocylindrales bacterium]|jgi:hypothetical protein
MSILSKVKGWFVGAPEPEPGKKPAEPHASRHDRREAGRKRHHTTGEPAWEASDKVDEGAGPMKNPDAAPEILGGS